MGNTTRYTYDLCDRLTEERNALGKTQKYVYDKKGQLTQVTDSAGVITTYAYDSAGRLIREKKGQYETTYTYDKAGNLLTVTDDSGTIRRSYDKLNRVIQVTDCNGKTITYGYDELGNVISLTYPGGERVRYRYDACQNLTHMVDAAGKETQYRYDAAGNLTKTIRPDGSVEERSYDSAGRLSVLKDVSDGEIIQHLCYTYDALGNITGIEDKAESVQTKAKEPSSMTCTYGADNRLLTWNGKKVLYDEKGNMTHGPVDGDMAELSYDVYDRLVRVVTADGAVTKYFYDAEDVRIGAEHTDADGSTRTETFVTDRQSTYSRLLTVTSDAKTTTYSYGLGLTGVMEGSKTSYYHYNHLGSTTAITDSTGQVITRASYGTYGELLGVTGEAGGETLRFLYNGRYGVQTEENSLYYMRARYYNQDARRFVNLDPVRGELTNTQSLNRYAYVQGNPVRATDPLGLSPEEVEREIDVHLILGLLGCIPFAGAIFSAYDAYLYHKEGNYIMMAGSIVATIGSVCGTGGAAAKYLSKCGIISPKTATIVQKTLMGISLGSGVGYTGYLFGNSISKAIDEKEENGTISSATWKEMIGTAAIHAITTALGVGAAKRMSSPVLKETAKNTTPSTPTTTSATGTIAEVLDDGVGSVGRRKGGLELDLQFFARKKGSKSGTDVVQSKFNKLLNSDYYKTDFGYDCSEIAQDFYSAAGNKGTIYRIEGKNGFLKGYEYNDILEFDYHEVYSDGVYIYDSRYQNTPILKDDYFRALSEINPDGFDVFTKQ